MAAVVAAEELRRQESCDLCTEAEATVRAKQRHGGEIASVVDSATANMAAKRSLPWRKPFSRFVVACWWRPHTFGQQ